MNVFDELVAKYIMNKFRGYKHTPWAELSGYRSFNNNRKDIEDLFHHLQTCPGTKAVVTDWWTGPISDVTPDPEFMLVADISCPHGELKNFCYSDYQDLYEVIEWMEKNEENQSK